MADHERTYINSLSSDFLRKLYAELTPADWQQIYHEVTAIGGFAQYKSIQEVQSDADFSEFIKKGVFNAYNAQFQIDVMAKYQQGSTYKLESYVITGQGTSQIINLFGLYLFTIKTLGGKFWFILLQKLKEKSPTDYEAFTEAFLAFAKQIYEKEEQYLSVMNTDNVDFFLSMHLTGSNAGFMNISLTLAFYLVMVGRKEFQDKFSMTTYVNLRNHDLFKEEEIGKGIPLDELLSRAKDVREPTSTPGLYAAMSLALDSDSPISDVRQTDMDEIIKTYQKLLDPQSPYYLITRLRKYGGFIKCPGQGAIADHIAALMNVSLSMPHHRAHIMKLMAVEV